MAAKRTRKVQAQPSSASRGGPAADAIIGRRAEQQDAWRLASVRVEGERDALLIVVADGMGGHAGGSEASRLAIRAFETAFTGNARLATAKRLSDALDEANRAIGARARANRELAGMGCTLVGAVLDGTKLSWISVGDTLLLASEKGRMRRLNADHSLGGVLAERAKRGEISWHEARTSPQRHMLRSAVNGERIALIDQNEVQLSKGDLVVAATDGILTLTDETLGELLARSAEPAEAVAALLEAVRRDMPDDQDNTTIAAARVMGSGKPRRKGAAWRRPRGRTLAAAMAFLIVLALIVLLAAILLDEMLNRPSAQPSPPPSAPAEISTPANAVTAPRPPGLGSAAPPVVPADTKAADAKRTDQSGVVAKTGDTTKSKPKDPTQKGAKISAPAPAAKPQPKKTAPTADSPPSQAPTAETAPSRPIVRPR